MTCMKGQKGKIISGKNNGQTFILTEQSYEDLYWSNDKNGGHIRNRVERHQIRTKTTLNNAVGKKKKKRRKKEDPLALCQLVQDMKEAWLSNQTGAKFF